MYCSLNHLLVGRIPSVLQGVVMDRLLEQILLVLREITEATVGEQIPLEPHGLILGQLVEEIPSALYDATEKNFQLLNEKEYLLNGV